MNGYIECLLDLENVYNVLVVLNFLLSFIIEYLFVCTDIVCILFLVKMMVTDPLLAVKCLAGPCTPYQFRLEGPGKWEGARDAILTQWDRTLITLKTRPLGFKKEPTITISHLFLFISVIIACWLSYLVFIVMK